MFFIKGAAHRKSFIVDPIMDVDVIELLQHSEFSQTHPHIEFHSADEPPLVFMYMK
jgi:hypothetical protein